MKSLSIVTVMFMILLSAACGRKGETADGNVCSLSRVKLLHDSARNARINKAPSDVYISIQKEAVGEVRKSHGDGMAVEVLSQMGYFLCRMGNYADGLMYLQEAMDSLRRAPGRTDPREEAKLLGNTANFYCRVGLYTEALDLNRQAIEMSLGSKSSIVADLWRMRSAIFEDMNRADSMFYCLDISLKAAEVIEDTVMATICRVIAENQTAGHIIEHHEQYPERVVDATKTLQRNISPGMAMRESTDSLLIGRGLFLTGDRKKGLQIMNAAINTKRSSGLEDLQWGLDLLALTLVENELSPRSLSIYKESRRLTDTINHQKMADALLNADFKYRTSQLKNEKLLLEAEQRYTRQQIISWSVTASLVILILILLALRIINTKNRKLRENKLAIEQLFAARIELNRQIEQLNDRIEEQKQSSGSETAPAPEPQIFSIAILKKEDEARFRQLFSAVYPGLIEKIRASYPDISPSAELIIMLIRLKKSNNEIAFALGIKRESVAKARYRLRTLFSLDKETDLNEYIQSL